MNAWDLPTSLFIGGKEWNIRTDFRAIIDILSYFNDPDMEDDEKWIVCLTILYEDFDDMPTELHQEAAEKAVEFIDMGIKDSGGHKPHTMDWEQDAPLIISGINKVMGKELRAEKYLHWWTFLSSYMEIGEGTFSTVVSIRSKKAKGQKLDKWEKDFYKNNRAIVDLENKYSEEDKEEQERLKNLLG